jgi:phage terminase Nu1 subunit (DNA packaging protein)
MKFDPDIEALVGDLPSKPKRGRAVVDHRQKLVLAQAQLAEIRAAKMRGELVPAADVEAEWANILADVRQQLMAIPSRVGAKLALPREAVAALDAEIRAVLTALAAQEGIPDASRTRAA